MSSDKSARLKSGAARVTTLREDLGPDAEGAGHGFRVSWPGRIRSGWRRINLAGLPGLVRRHWLFSLALALSALPRVVAMLGFWPAVLFRLDTFDYLWGAVHLAPNVVNPSGYSVFLRVFLPLHSIVTVIALQHVLGMGAAVMIYALLLRYGIPRWGAVLAATPVLFDPAELLVEQFVMADLLAMVLLIAAVTLLLMTASPTLARVITVGLLLGLSVTVRPTTLPVLLLVPAYLLARGWSARDWRRPLAALAAGTLPVLGYMGWFAADHGSFNLTNSGGLFLWSRTMSFANCTVIRPPAGLSALCPNAQPGRLAEPVPALRPRPKRYLWNHRTWQWQPRTSPFVPDSAAFTPANNDRALRFAAAAIEAQPLAYAGVVFQESLQPFNSTDTLRFPDYQPHTATLDGADRPYALGAIRAYTGNTQGVAGDIGYDYGTRLVPPWAAIMQEYQRIVFLPGAVFALVVLTGLAGILIPRRRSADAVFLWGSAVILMVAPTAEHEYTYRYVIPTVPLFVIAAALALRTRPTT